MTHGEQAASGAMERARVAATPMSMYLALFASGAAALLFETLWFRQAALAFGSSVWASALVTSAFMLGLALGSAVAARIVTSAVARFRAYAALEATIAVTGVALVLLLPVLARVMAPFDVQNTENVMLARGVRAVASLALLCVPSMAMGTTLPLALGGLRAFDRAFGRDLGKLYALNTLGAMTGALLGELWLLERCGVQRTALVAAALSGTAALLGLRLAARARATATPAHVPAPPVARRLGLAWLAAAALGGFAMLGLEVVWLRMLMLFLADTPLAFAMVLSLVLGGIALGSFAASALLARAPDAGSRAAPIAAALACAGVTAGLLAFPHALARFYQLEQGALDVLAIALPLVLPSALASGAALPLIASARAATIGRDADEGGAVLAVNGVGAALGGALAALWMLPTLGMEGALLALAALEGLSALVLFGAIRRAPVRIAAALGAIALGFALFPRGVVEGSYVRGSVGRWMRDDDEIVAVREGLTATLVHVRHRALGEHAFDQLATNSYSMSSNDFGGRRYMKLFAYLPWALHGKPREALVVGFGVGNTAAALGDIDDVTRIDVVDTSPETFALARGLRFEGRSPLDDPRVRLHVEDGRHFLAGTDARYDLITGEPPPPFLAGVESLYTREYFQLAHDRLNEGGFVSYWLPTMNLTAGGARAIVAAFCGAFADCSLWHGAGENYLLLGSRGARGPVPLDDFVRPWGNPKVREELARLGLEHPVQLGALFIGDASYLRALTDADLPLDDDHPRRILAPDEPGAKASLLAAWDDTGSARARFDASAHVGALLPERVRRDTRAQFEGQRLLNDLLSRAGGPRSLEVLDQVLTRTPWTLPVLLMLDSDPDLQRVARSGAVDPAKHPAIWRHRLAGSLAARDYAAALADAGHLRDEALPIRGLRAYLEKKARGGT
ncbi:MAG: hypothetical protein ABW252_22875 [Polyangiales bacterium]